MKPKESNRCTELVRVEQSRLAVRSLFASTVLSEMVNASLAMAHKVRLPDWPKKMLIVDDEIGARESLRLLFQRRGFDVVTAQNAYDEGISIVSNANFDVIICDFRMPGMDGDEFYREVELLKPELCKQFIFMTGFGGERLDRFIVQINGTLVRKPFNVDEMLSIVSRVVDSREQTVGGIPSGN